MSDNNVTVPHNFVTAVDHVGIAVPDFDAAVEWYRANMGFVNYHEEVNEEQGVREAMLGPAEKTEGGTLVQILAPLNEESTIAKYIDKKGPGIQQYALRVTDMDALMAHLKEQGTRVLYEVPKNGTAGSRINFVHPKDAGGVLLELVEPAKYPPRSPPLFASLSALRRPGARILRRRVFACRGRIRVGGRAAQPSIRCLV